MAQLLQIVANTKDRHSPKAVSDWIPAAEAKKQFKTLSEAGKWPHQEAKGHQPPRPILELRTASGNIENMAPKEALETFQSNAKEAATKAAEEKAARKAARKTAKK